MSERISILGAGWLGAALGERLAAMGITVKASTTSQEKIEGLAQAGMDPHKIELAVEMAGQEWKSFLETDALLICLPPNAFGDQPEQAIEELCRSALKAGCRRLVLVSSTSVYPEMAGEIIEPEAYPDSERGMRQREIEKAFEAHWHLPRMIIRMGGLFGPKRHPGRFLAGKEHLKGGNQPVNLIHLEDCIGILSKAIKLDGPMGKFHAVAPQHPSRQEFYTQAARNLGLIEPQFLPESQAEGKIINPLRICQALPYQFQFPDPLLALNAC